MKVLLIGLPYANNLGDVIICDVVKKLLLIKYKNIEIVEADLLKSKVDEKNELQINYLRSYKVSNIKKQISFKLTKYGIDTEYVRFKKASIKNKDVIDNICNNDFDLVVFAGGQLFRDIFIIPISIVVKYFNKYNIPVLFNACGVGEIRSKKMVNILSKTLNSENVKFISTRDDINTINDVFLKGSNKKAVITYDPALWTRSFYEISKETYDIVGLGIMYPDHINFNKAISFWKKLILYLNENKIKWKIFGNGSPADFQFAEFVLKKMGYAQKELDSLIMARPFTAGELVYDISSFNSIISFRLHSLIIAYSLNIPAIPVIWDDKVEFFYKNIKMGKICKNINSTPEEILNELNLVSKAHLQNLMIKENQKIYLRNLLWESIEEVL